MPAALQMAEGRFPKYFFVIPVKLGYAFITHFKSGVGDPLPFHDHQTLGFKETKLLLVLERTQAGEYFKMTMQ